MVEAILFDFDGTLVDYIDSDARSLQWLHSQLGSDINFDTFLNTAVEEIMKFHCLVNENKTDPLLLHEFRLKNTFTRHNLKWDDIFIKIYRERLIDLCVPFPGVEKLLSGIKKRVKTAIVSNAYDGAEQRKRIRSSGIEALFDVIVIAGDIGVFKPDPAIFSYALSCLNVSPDQALYVGDSITHDINGAKSAGMKTVLLNKNIKRDAKVADYFALGIDGLQTLLDQLVFKRKIEA
jgi:HAD superfamily hydrolase (TIGR01509 family)